jgi:glycolate oxidase FAD binding subunit
MIQMNDRTAGLAESISAAASVKRSLQIVGGSSKLFYGREPEGEVLAVGDHTGITAYDPTELVVTVRAGTRLSELTEVLRRERQMLPFEPPLFGSLATIGGTVACGLSGPSRPYRGAVRDFVLGVGLINGRGEQLRFGGQVMKNVAGYDVSRLTTGAMGTLGVILDVSIGVHPLPESEKTLYYELTEQQALKKMNEVSGRPLPLTGACYYQGVLSLRLSGSVEGVSAAVDVLGGSQASDGDSIWSKLRDHSHPYFLSDKPLWRLSVPSVAGSLDLAGETFVEWGGALRWLQSELSPDLIRASVEALGGHATLFRGGDRSGSVFHPNPRALHELNVRLKRTFDPDGILNPGRLYPDI